MAAALVSALQTASLSIGVTPGSKKGSDAKYFATTAKGEIHEWKNDLNSLNKEKIKEAVKKVIAAMTVGKDVSSLFTDVIKGLQTDNIELKKLVYLYIINYARSQPEKAILIVASFQRDATDKSPLLRALAIRTMGCIRVDRITEHLAEPLAKALQDKDAYVRKTAAVCVAKLYDINRELVEEQGFLEALRNMISDSNPMVVANAVAALAEIAETSGKDVFQINKAMLAKLTFALNEASEWGQVFILDCLAKYEPSAKDAEEIIERVTPRLKHANSAVAMSAVKIIMRYMTYLSNEEKVQALVMEKLPPPLITLLSENRPEIQYVALRNINLIVQKQPLILENAVKHFFCKYNDPIYVKMEKLEIMIKIANVKNIDKVLMELKEYASEVDVDFVRKSVLAIGRVAIKIPQAAEACVKTLLDLIETKVNYVVQEAMIVIKDIFRKYPSKYEKIISTLCENLDTLDEPEAKASLIWIIGEYAARIENAHDLLETFIDSFHDESPQVQLQLLTSVVKLFLVKPSQNKALVEQVLDMATQHTDNPDLRDRGYVYWRLLSTDPEAARQVVCAEKPQISDDTFQLETSVLDVLITNIATLASVYHKPPEYFIKDAKASVVLKEKKRRGDDEDEEEDAEAEADGEQESADVEEEEGAEEAEGEAPARPTPAGGGGGGQSAAATLDLFGFDEPAPAAAPAPKAAEGKLLLAAAQGNGLQIKALYERVNSTPVMKLIIENSSSTAVKKVQLKFRENYLGVAPSTPSIATAIAPGATVTLPVTLDSTPENTNVSKPVVDIALKSELGVVYFKDKIAAHLLFQEEGKLESKEFLSLWRSLDSKEISQALTTNLAAAAIKEVLEAVRVFHIASRAAQGIGKVMYFSLTFRGVVTLVEVTLKDDHNGKVCLRCAREDYGNVVLAHVVSLLS